MKLNKEIEDIYSGIHYFLNNLKKPNSEFSFSQH